MSAYRLAGTCLLTFAFTLPFHASAQTATDTTNQTKSALKHDRKAEKAQAHADKKERKALSTHEQKKADKAQDKADRKAETPPN